MIYYFVLNLLFPTDRVIGYLAVIINTATGSDTKIQNIKKYIY